MRGRWRRRGKEGIGRGTQAGLEIEWKTPTQNHDGQRNQGERRRQTGKTFGEKKSKTNYIRPLTALRGSEVKKRNMKGKSWGNHCLQG